MNAFARPGGLSVSLDLLGVAIVTYVLFASFSDSLGAVGLTVGVIGVFAWLATIVVVASAPDVRAPSARPAWATPLWLLPTLLTVMAVCGALVAGPTFGLGVVLCAAALLRAMGNPAWPLWWGVVLMLASLALVAVGVIVAGSAAGGPNGGHESTSALGLLAIEGGIVISALGGLSRRQRRVADEQADALRDARLAAREERAELKALADRQAIAREIHDVLAHSLGGLVIQLDAVDALLESGDNASAEVRVRDARRLAASGLSEARRAVDALREPSAAPAVPIDALLAEVGELIAAERALGAAVRLTTTPTGPTGLAIESEGALALRRAVQESLTNARKHSSGAPVAVSVQADAPPTALRVTVSNPLTRPLDALASTGAGRGLQGMRERFDRVPGSELRFGAHAGQFVVEAQVPVCRPGAPEAEPRQAKLSRVDKLSRRDGGTV